MRTRPARMPRISGCQPGGPGATRKAPPNGAEPRDRLSVLLDDPSPQIRTALFEEDDTAGSSWSRRER